MTFEKLFNLAGQIITLATIAVVLSSPNTARVITASASGFSGAVKTAMGR